MVLPTSLSIRLPLAENRSRTGSGGYLVLWLPIGVCAVVAASVLRLADVAVDWFNLAPLAGLTASLVAAQAVYARHRPDAKIADSCGLLAILIVSTLLAAMISHVGLRLQAPFVDGLFSSADAAIGWD